MPLFPLRPAAARTARLSRAALAAAATCALLGSPAAQAAPDAALLAAARGAQPAVLQTLREMVAIESGTMDAPGLARMTDYAEKRLKSLGGQVTRKPATAGHSELLSARFTGTGQRRLMLMAHLDTIYWPGELQKSPIKEENGRLYGPGIADDKGGVAMILHALEVLRAQGWKDYAQITVLFNGDEESGSPGSGEAIATLADQHDVVLSFEPTVAQDPGVLLAAAGVGEIVMKVKGRASHAGAAPDLGRNAALELSHQMLATADLAKAIPGAQMNWTTSKAGNVRNQIPDSAEAGADVRLTRPDAAEKLLAAVQAKVAEGKRVPDTEVSVALKVGRPPFVGGPRTQALAERARAIAAELGEGKPLGIHPITGGGTDAGFANRSGKAVVLESLGLPGWGYHAKDEYIQIDQIVPRLYLVTRLMMDLGKN